MGITNLYSKRAKKVIGKEIDVYQYKNIPQIFRNQVVHILKDIFPDKYARNTEEPLQQVHDALCREYGIYLLNEDIDNYFDSIATFIENQNKADSFLDVVELVFQIADTYVRSNPGFYPRSVAPDAAIDELNSRFREHGIGYQFESGRILKIDSQLIHAEVVKPALSFLSSKTFKGANDEFLSAYSHYREEKYKECLVDCLKAFESTLKVICKKRKWKYKETDTAKKLLDIIFEKRLIPGFMQSHFTGLRATLEGGVPTVRNKLGGHGQGSESITVPESIASYALHLTASNILLLVRSDVEMK